MDALSILMFIIFALCFIIVGGVIGVILGGAMHTLILKREKKEADAKFESAEGNTPAASYLTGYFDGYGRRDSREDIFAGKSFGMVYRDGYLAGVTQRRNEAIYKAELRIEEKKDKEHDNS